jgi:starch phosphorylase
VVAGHDQFPLTLVHQIIGRHEVEEMKDVFCCGDLLNMTFLALNLSHYVNGVAKKHGEITRLLFAGYNIDAITNGVHAASWAATPLAELFDRYIPGWRQDNYSLRYAMSIPKQEIWQAHEQAKKNLLRHVNLETNAGMDVDVFTIGFARRAAPPSMAVCRLCTPEKPIRKTKPEKNKSGEYFEPATCCATRLRLPTSVITVWKSAN